jgi:DNA-binding CsgD family transcriptional regulator
MTHTQPPTAGRLGIVGRAQGLSRVEEFVDAVPVHSQVLLIRGESGIGKTTVWRYGLRRCRDAGYRVLEVRPAEEEMRVPLVALDDLFRDVQPGETWSQVDDPFSLGRRVFDAWRRIVRDDPLVLAIDDLQWLDPASAQVLRFALRRSEEYNVSLIAAVRSGAGEADPLELDRTARGFRRQSVDLRPLSIDGIRMVLDQTVHAISRPMLRRIYAMSAGNPLYAIELARGLSADELKGSPEDVRLPDSLQHAVARRIDAAPPHLHPLLALAAALGPTGVAELRSCAPDLDVDALLSEARDRRLLAVEDDLAVRFTHPALAAAVYTRMNPIARRALHARLADRIEAPDLRARHLALSTDAPDDRVAGLLEAAAERARRRGDSHVAAEFARHSRRLTPPADAEAASRRALAQIRYVAAAGAVQHALELADRLIDASPPGRLRAHAYITRAKLEDDDLTTEEALLLRGLDDAGADERLRAEILDLLGWLRGHFLGDLPGGIELSRQALETAERLGDKALEAEAASGLAHLSVSAGTPRRDLLERALAIEAEIGGPALGGGTRSLLAIDLRLGGDLASAREIHQSVHREIVEAGIERFRPHSLYMLASAAAYGGDFARAEELIGQAWQAARDNEDAHVEAWIRYTRAVVAAWRGRASDARALIEQIIIWATKRGERPAMARAQALSGLLALSEADPRTAADELGRAAGQLADMGIANPAVIPALPDAVEAYALAGDTDTAARLLHTLERQAAALGNDLAAAVTARSRGCLLAASGRPDPAVDQLREAATTFDRLGFAPDAARSVLSSGRALLRAGRRTAAADALEQATGRFTRMGATLWHDRAAEDLERAAPGRLSGALTRTERNVAALVAQGRRNKQIGQALFMSVATVEAHLTRIYRKLGIGSRSELTRLVAEGRVPIGGGSGDPPG